MRRPDMINSLKYKVLRRIRGKGRGFAHICKDFLDLGSRSAIDKTLSRLAHEGLIRRLKPGIYDYPRRNPKLGGDLAPINDEVAMAIARKTGSRIRPAGAIAANALGLSTQVPARRIYITDGPSRKIKIGGQTLIFRHAAPREMATVDEMSSLVFQALRYLGRKFVEDKIIKRLKYSLSSKNKKALTKDIRYAADWMRPIVENICKKKD